MKRLLRFFLCWAVLVQTQKGLGQDSAAAAVVISPVLFTPVSVAIQAGFQFRLSKRFALLVEGAYPTFYPTNDYERIKYWRSGLAWKIYSSKPQLNRRYYAFQVSYLYRQLTDVNDGIVHRRDGEYRYDAATINSPALSLALITGKEFNTGNRKFFADVFGGAGVRYLFNKYKAVNLRLTSLDRPKDSFDWLFPDEGWRFDYPLTRLHLTGGVKFGMRL